MESSRSLEHVLSMQGGEDDVSYAKNSYGPATALASSKQLLTSAIHSMNFTKGRCSSTHLKIADLGCAVGENTFSTVDTVVEVLRIMINGESETEMEVFFSDLPSNDFNSLFRSLDEKVNGPRRKYFAAGVPGSFYKRLFPKGELHVVVTMSALQWLSQGLIEEDKRDGFNIPVYLRNTEEITAAITRCGGFKIEKMETLKIANDMNGKLQELITYPDSYGQAMANMVQAGLKPMVEAYLGPDLTRKLFGRYAIRAAADKETLNKNSCYYMIAVSAIRV